MTAAAKPRIELVVFDWAGTTVDHGCFGPVAAFVGAFARDGVEITPDEARGPMGLHKRDHITALFERPGVQRQWRAVHGKDPTKDDMERLFQRFSVLQMEVIDHHSELVPSLLECVSWLRGDEIRIGATTGYFAEAANRVYKAAAAQGYSPDLALCTDDVLEGRPKPWMIFRIMEGLRIYPPAHVVKVGDTAPDIGEGLNAGAWTVGVTRTGSDVGLTAPELAALEPQERQRRVLAARDKLLAAGAHGVIESIAELPKVIEGFNDLLARGGKP
jgi:phosphonoacetaldehyde hydrolase